MNFDTNLNFWKQELAAKDWALNYESAKNMIYSSTTISSIDAYDPMQSTLGFSKDFTFTGYDHRKARPTSQSGVLYHAILENKNMTLK